MQIKNYKNSKITYIKEEIERKSILYYLEIYYIKEAKNLFTFQQKFKTLKMSENFLSRQSQKKQEEIDFYNRSLRGGLKKRETCETLRQKIAWCETFKVLLLNPTNPIHKCIYNTGSCTI